MSSAYVTSWERGKGEPVTRPWCAARACELGAHRGPGAGATHNKMAGSVRGAAHRHVRSTGGHRRPGGRRPGVAPRSRGAAGFGPTAHRQPGGVQGLPPGRDNLGRRQAARGPAAFRQALAYYEQAVALDSGFVEAWYRLAGMRIQIYKSGGTVSPAESDAARAAAERMLAVAPERPEGRVALGNYYLNVRNDTRRGLEQFTLALRVGARLSGRAHPGGVRRGSLGALGGGPRALRPRVHPLDPRSAAVAATLAQTLPLAAPPRRGAGGPPTARWRSRRPRPASSSSR